MNSYFDKGISALLAVAASAMAAVLIHSEFFTQPTAGLRRKSEYIADWQSMLQAGRSIGAEQAPVRIIEFTDFQCPFCRQFNTTLHNVAERFPGKVAVSVVHFPLKSHAMAEMAARTSECAYTQGQFSRAIDVLFEQQDSLGRKPWRSFARDFQVADTSEFARCVDAKVPVPIVSAGLALGQRINLNGTPTVILNGWRYGVPPSDSELVRAIGDLLERRPPYKGFPKQGLPDASP